MTSSLPFWVWGLGLIVAFPLATVVLGEVIHRLRRRGLPIAATVRLVRDVLVPMLVLLVFMQHLL
jgi:hypothetical protein